MNIEHPTYPNPTIQEALCEIHFCLPDGVAWKPSLFGKLFKHIQPDFPEMEPVMQIGVEFLVGPDKIGQTLLPPRQRMRYKHASRNLLLQLSENIFTVNLLPQYPGWEQMSRDVLEAWKRAGEIIEPAGITRIGLRYINRIERTRPDEPPGDWLAASDYIPTSALETLPGFLSRLEVRPDPHSRLIVTLGESRSEADQMPNAIVFDIDCIVEKATSITDAAITAEITQLHEIAWTIFAASKTPRLEQWLHGGEK